jgi:serine/threonine protein kinase
MDAELERVAHMIEQAETPEDVFGDLKGTADQMTRQAQKIFRRLSMVVHPDRNRGDKVAADAFKKLHDLWEAAGRKIENGTYGDRAAGTGEQVTVHTRKRAYTVGGQVSHGDICSLYSCHYQEGGDQTPGIFKVARDPRNNGLVQNEARILKVLHVDGEHERFRSFVPELVDSFGYRDGGSSVIRQANVLSWLEGFYSLKEVMAHYPKGVDPRDMAWMWRRLLVALGFAHVNGVVHGAVLPTHVLIHPEKHGLVLVDWSYAVHNPETSGERVRVASADYEQCYPPEVKAGEVPTPALDIYMGARCMVYLLGGDPVTGNLSTTVSRPIRAFFRGCTPPGPKQRPSDAWGLKEEFDELIERLWGRRRYRPFAIPPGK